MCQRSFDATIDSLPDTASARTLQANLPALAFALEPAPALNAAIRGDFRKFRQAIEEQLPADLLPLQTQEAEMLHVLSSGLSQGQQLAFAAEKAPFMKRKREWHRIWSIAMSKGLLGDTQLTIGQQVHVKDFHGKGPTTLTILDFDSKGNVLFAFNLGNRPCHDRYSFAGIQRLINPEPARPLSPITLADIETLASKDSLETKRDYEQALTAAYEIMKTDSAIVEIDRSKPTIVVSDIHGRRDFLYNVMKLPLKSMNGRTIFQLLEDDEINVVLAGDLVHTEKGSNWLERRDDDSLWVTEEKLAAEMVRNLGVGHIVARLKTRFPNNFHFCRGNHDDVQERISPQAKFLNSGLTESSVVRSWLMSEFGEQFVRAMIAVEDTQPLMVISDDKKLVISHTIGNKSLTREQIESRGMDALKTLTWSDNRADKMPGNTLRTNVEQTHRNLEIADGAVHVLGHREIAGVIGQLYRSQLDGTIVQICESRMQLIAFFPSSESGLRFNPDRMIRDLTEL